MREAGRIVAEVHQRMRELVAPGISTGELDEAAETLIRARGGVPSFKGYGGFPASICASVDDEVVHGIPSRTRILREGSIVGIDVGVYLDGFHGDAALTLPVGRVEERVRELLEVTAESLYRGIGQARPGQRIGDISHAIQRCCEERGFSVVREYVGHGIGADLHEEPPVPNYGPPHRGVRLEAGMAIALEPMINMGTAAVELQEDGWTVTTRDHKPSAHFEHTIVITECGAEIMTVI